MYNKVFFFYFLETNAEAVTYSVDEQKSSPYAIFVEVGEWNFTVSIIIRTKKLQ